MLITASIGGGFAGFSVTLQGLLRSPEHTFAGSCLMIVFLAMYAFITYSGLLFVHDDRKIWPLLIAFAIQIPWVSSPFLAYRLSAGLHVTIGLVSGQPSGGFSVGSEWQCSILQRAPWAIGTNLFAAFMVVILARATVTVNTDGKEINRQGSAI
jgi:hypothetical protein